jgi:hypothetical protein
MEAYFASTSLIIRTDQQSLCYRPPGLQWPMLFMSSFAVYPSDFVYLHFDPQTCL